MLETSFTHSYTNILPSSWTVKPSIHAPFCSHSGSLLASPKLAKCCLTLVCGSYIFIDKDIVNVCRSCQPDCIIFWECSINNSPHDRWCYIESKTHVWLAVPLSFKDNCLVQPQGFVYTHSQIHSLEIEHWHVGALLSPLS